MYTLYKWYVKISDSRKISMCHTASMFNYKGHTVIKTEAVYLHIYPGFETYWPIAEKLFIPYEWFLKFNGYFRTSFSTGMNCHHELPVSK